MFSGIHVTRSFNDAPQPQTHRNGLPGWMGGFINCSRGRCEGGGYTENMCERLPGQQVLVFAVWTYSADFCKKEFEPK